MLGANWTTSNATVIAIAMAIVIVWDCTISLQMEKITWLLIASGTQTFEILVYARY